MDRALHDSISFQAAKLLCEHFLGDRWNRAFQVGKSHDLAAEQMEEDQELPAAFDELESLLDALRSRDRRVFDALTFR